MEKISVCIATYNGQKYIKDQLGSILCQLTGNDEVIISDDGSTDDTLAIIDSLKDSRIKIYHSTAKNVIRNFENAIRQATGSIIFLSDQDDIWKANKVSKMLEYFNAGYDVVTHDCEIINSKHEVIVGSYFKAIDSHAGFIRNIVKRNSYMGCCMAFRAKVKEAALPFPPKIPMHDLWIGLIAEVAFKPYFIDDKLVLYRQHETNFSDTSSGISKYSFWEKINFRLITLSALSGRIFKLVKKKEYFKIIFGAK